MAIQVNFSSPRNHGNTGYFVFQHAITDFTTHIYFPSGTVILRVAE